MSQPVPLDDLPLDPAECNCEFTPYDPADYEPGEEIEESWHYLRRCPKCKALRWSLHCPHDGYQKACECGETFPCLWKKATPPPDEERPEMSDQDNDPAAKLARIEKIIRDYHYALDTRNEPHPATRRCVTRIESVLGLWWADGREAARRATEAPPMGLLSAVPGTSIQNTDGQTTVTPTGD